MPPVNRARSRVLRALLSALAGGGLTAAGLGPLAGPALGATAVSGSQPAAEGGTGAQQTTTAEAGTTSTTTETATQPETPTTTTTTTTPATTTPTTSAPTPPPAPTTPQSTAPTSTEAQASAPAASPAPVPTVVLKRKQKATPSAPSNPSQTTTITTTASEGAKSLKRAKKATGPDNVASSPQMVAAEAGALAAVLASSEASAQALSFYRIPLFLLPIYKAAAVQYGVPWQILAAINEIETDYGSDLSVSTAGAVGWMQFEPSTWLQYGVDALNAGYADPYNPVDAIFAAARYLRAAGAATDLRAAILAYNHSEEYVESVLLRAKLISTYPKAVIATLTGLVDGRLPVTGKHVAWEPLTQATPTLASATAGATPLVGNSAAAAAKTSTADVPSPAVASTKVPGVAPAPSPTAAAAAASARAAAAVAARPLELVDLMSAPNASVVAVQDGRIVQLGHSRKLGRYLVLRDVYGDIFTYAGLGSIAPSYVLPKPPHARHTKSTVIEAASKRDPAPSQPASAGTQSPLTLQVKTPAAGLASAGRVSVQTEAAEPTPPGMDKVRLFAHPGNPDARAAAAASASRRARSTSAGQRLALRRGSVVASGTVLGRVRVPPGAQDGHLRFAIRPAGDPETVNPGPVLANWAQLQSALHPRGAKATNPLLGATASDVFLLSKEQLERAVLAEPGITLDACARDEVASGAVDRRLLAVLAFLSRSGLEPTVSAVHCAHRHATTAAEAGGALDISAINGTAVAGHQGSETITELTIRALLTLPARFVPHEIASLMRFPGHPNTLASRAFANRIHLEFRPAPATPKLSAAAASTVAHSARSGLTAPAPLVTSSALSAVQWNQLMERVAALPTPTIRNKPSSAAVPDPKRP
jgi:membrane-bound lytic murein transglycosylase B